jgi:LPS sulfotransferase NodH
MTASGPLFPVSRPSARPRQGARLATRRLRHHLNLLRRYWLCPHRSHMPLFILATYRSGSNLLIDYLQSIPGVQCYTEVLSPYLPIGPRRADLTAKQALRHLRYSLQSLKAPVRGCKLMLDQLAGCRLSLADLRRTFPAAKYIILYRESLAEQLLSCRSAQVTQQWIVHRGQVPRQARVVIEPLELRWYCDEMRRLYQSVLDHAWLQDCGALISYEELAADPRAIFCERICPLLGLPPTAPRTSLQKQSPQHPAERIANYDQIAALLASPHCRQHYAWPRAHAA